MKIVIAIDSFKGSLTSLEAGEATKKGILRALPDAQVTVLPLADGGEGTTEALCFAYGASEVEVRTVDPLARDMVAHYFLAGKTAIMEMSACSGLYLVEADKRNPMVTTTYGLGLMIRDAIGRGATDFIIGIGGSATNDAGLGMLCALGWRFFDKDGAEVIHGAHGAGRVAKIDTSAVMPALAECKFRVLCDVQNPLLGENGASYVYAPQKGAKAHELPILDTYLASFAKVSAEYYPHSDAFYPGAGAAGGLGFAFLSYLNSTLISGAQAVLDATGFEIATRDADILVTGEGRIDSQTINGKAPIVATRIAKKYVGRVIGLCAITGTGYEICHENGIDEIYPCADPTLSVEENMTLEVAKACVERTAYRVFSGGTK